MLAARSEKLNITDHFLQLKQIFRFLDKIALKEESVPAKCLKTAGSSLTL